MNKTIIDQLIKQEKQLFDKSGAPKVLAALIDDDFIEIGSSAKVYDKAEVVRWLKSVDTSVCVGRDFKAQQLAEDIILLTYVSSIKKTPDASAKLAMRSSIWRATQGVWRMVFHQGTPLPIA